LNCTAGMSSLADFEISVLPELRLMFHHIPEDLLKCTVKALHQENRLSMDSAIADLLVLSRAIPSSVVSNSPPQLSVEDGESKIHPAVGGLAPDVAREVQAELDRAIAAGLIAQDEADAELVEALALSQQGPEADPVSWGLQRPGDGQPPLADQEAGSSVAPPSQVEEIPEDAVPTVHTAVLALGCMPPGPRTAAVKALHQIFRKVLQKPDDPTVRRIPRKNQAFQNKVGQFPEAAAVLCAGGFKLEQDKLLGPGGRPEFVYSFPCNLDSDNPRTLAFLECHSLLECIASEPGFFGDSVLAPISSGDENSMAVCPSCSNGNHPDNSMCVYCDATLPPRPRKPRTVEMPPLNRAPLTKEQLADLHERRSRDPRKFASEAKNLGGAANKVVVDVRLPVQESTRRADGKREFNLQDLEDMRYGDAIRNMPSYADDYWNSRGNTGSYSAMLDRYYDPEYIGRRALDETNRFRASEGRPPLRWCPELTRIARIHADEMASGRAPFSHDGFDERMRAVPYYKMGGAENLAYNSGSADAARVAVDGWIKSPGHCKNLLATNNYCGIGVSRSASGCFYLTQLFTRTPEPVA